MESNSAITIEGSSKFVVQLLECALMNILYQRGVYSSDDFDVGIKYGMSTMVSTNKELIHYVNQITTQLEVWLTKNSICKVVIVIRDLVTDDVVERWHFDIELNKGENGIPMPENIPPEELEELHRKSIEHMKRIMRQITASVSYLPDLSDECTFNVLVYADEDVEVPASWGDSDAHLIPGGGQHLRLKTFSTMVHKVEPFVAYKMDDTL